MSVPSNQGGGAHSHLAIIMAQAEYNVMVGLGDLWDNPVNPGVTSDILGNNATQFQIADNNRTFAADIVEWNIYLATSQALTTQLIAAIDPKFLDELKHKALGFSSNSCRTLHWSTSRTRTLAHSSSTQMSRNSLENGTPPKSPLNTFGFESRNIVVLLPLATISSLKRPPCVKRSTASSKLASLKMQRSIGAKTPTPPTLGSILRHISKLLTSNVNAKSPPKAAAFTAPTWPPPPTWRPLYEPPSRPNSPTT
jgi:hypothetical protein